MKTFRSALLLLAAVGFAAPCFAHHMAVVVSKQSSVSNLTSAQLGKIFRGEMKKWPNGTPVMLVLHRASPGETTTPLVEIRSVKDSVKIVRIDGKVPMEAGYLPH